MNAATLECPVSYQHSRFVEKWVQRETAPSPPAEQRQFTSSAGPTDLRVGDARTGVFFITGVCSCKYFL